MESGHALIIKGDLTTDQDVQDNSKTPDVDFGAGILPGLQELRSGKVQTSTKRLQGASRGKQVAETKIDDLDVSILADEDVLNLQVTVDDTVPMTVVQGTGNLTTELSGLLFFQLAVGNNVVQHLAPVDVFEQHVPMVVGSNDISHPTYIRMIDQADDGRLSSGSDFFGRFGTIPIGLGAMFVGGLSWHNLYGNLRQKKRKKKSRSAYERTSSSEVDAYLLASIYVLG